MQAMKKGDLAFFYHSSCKVPGVVGIMEIVEEALVDESAFNVRILITMKVLSREPKVV